MKIVKTILSLLQAYVHGNAWRPENQQQNGHVNDAWCVPWRSQDTRRVPEFSAFQVKDNKTPQFEASTANNKNKKNQ